MSINETTLPAIAPMMPQTSTAHPGSPANPAPTKKTTAMPAPVPQRISRRPISLK
jgi:hypothetical protein